jgi:hypothetical protein
VHFGAIEKLEAKKKKKLVLTSLQLTRLYSTAGEAQVLKRTQRLINQLEMVLQKARLEVLQDYRPETISTVRCEALEYVNEIENIQVNA